MNAKIRESIKKSGCLMIDLLKHEFKELGRLLKDYYQEWVVLSMAALMFVLYRSHPLGDRMVTELVYLALIPILSIVILLRKNPLDFGLRLGDFRRWGFFVLVAVIIALPVLIISSFNSTVLRYYRDTDINMIEYVFRMAVILFGWEFIFRGYLLFGLKERFKEGSIFIQMIPFVLLHLGKPEIEVLSCIVTGILFGYIAYRGGSFWPVYIIHLFINVANRIIVNIRLQ
jgi:uncharacterized protein